MEIVAATHLDILKDLTRAIAAMEIKTAEDCHFLRHCICMTTGYLVSEIALQRLFGIAPCKFQPSFYTLNVLSRFCGFDSWQIFLVRNERY